MFGTTRLLRAADGVGIALHRLEAAPAARPPLLWGHANGYAAACYAPLLNDLARDFDVWAWDARGQGASGAASETSLEAMAGDAALALAAVAEATGGVPHVATHSFAGIAVLWQALHRGAAWRSGTFFEPPLVMPAGLAEGQAQHEARVAGTLRRRADWPGPDALAERLAGSPAFAFVTPEALAIHARAILRPGGDGQTLRRAPAMEAAVYRAVWTTAPFEALHPLGRPVAFIGSDGSALAPPSPSRLAQPAAAVACGGSYAMVPGSSHLVALERPAACAALVRATAARGGAA